jgi:hypothetical protein
MAVTGVRDANQDARVNDERRQHRFQGIPICVELFARR